MKRNIINYVVKIKMIVRGQKGKFYDKLDNLYEM